MLYSLQQKIASPLMWHPPLHKREEPEWTFLPQLEEWAAGRAALACWIPLMVKLQNPNVKKYQGLWEKIQVWNFTSVTTVWLFLLIQRWTFLHGLLDGRQGKHFCCAFILCLTALQWQTSYNEQKSEKKMHFWNLQFRHFHVWWLLLMRYFVFFLLGPLNLSLSCLSFKKGKRKGNIHRIWAWEGCWTAPRQLALEPLSLCLFGVVGLALENFLCLILLNTAVCVPLSNFPFRILPAADLVPDCASACDSVFVRVCENGEVCAGVVMCVHQYFCGGFFHLCWC